MLLNMTLNWKDLLFYTKTKFYNSPKIANFFLNIAFPQKS